MAEVDRELRWQDASFETGGPAYRRVKICSLFQKGIAVSGSGCGCGSGSGCGCGVLVLVPVVALVLFFFQ